MLLYAVLCEGLELLMVAGTAELSDRGFEVLCYVQGDLKVDSRCKFP